MVNHKGKEAKLQECHTHSTTHSVKTPFCHVKNGRICSMYILNVIVWKESIHFGHIWYVIMH